MSSITKMENFTFKTRGTRVLKQQFPHLAHMKIKMIIVNRFHWVSEWIGCVGNEKYSCSFWQESSINERTLIT